MLILTAMLRAILTGQESEYYYAKGLKEDSADEAIAKFKLLIGNANFKEDTEWIFKSYKQLAKLSYHQRNFDDVLHYISQLMTLIPQLNGHYAEESMNKLLSRYASSTNTSFVSRMFDIIVSYLESSGGSAMSGQRLWLKININRLNNALEASDWAHAKLLIDSINYRLEDVSELTKNSYGLEVIAAEIAYTMKTDGDLSKLSLLYRKSIGVNAAITHPRVMGTIRECGGTILFYRKNYDKARVEFYECFKNYDEAGSAAKKKILKYLSICSLLTEEEVNPFESQETQTYALLPEYQNLIELAKCYERQDLNGYLHVVTKMHDTNDELSSDKIFQQSQEQILHNLKVKLLINYLSAYSVIKYDTIIRKLQLSGDDELEQLIVSIANSGVGVNVRLNFSDRYIEVPSEPAHLILPVGLDAHVVCTNRKLLDLIQFRGIFGKGEEKRWNSEGVLSAAVPSREDDGTLPGDSQTKQDDPKVFPGILFKQEDEWLQYMRSAFPCKVQSTVSQKEQIFTEQQEDSKQAANNTDDNPENLAAKESTTAGILGSSLDFGNANEDEEDEVPTSKLDLLETWTLQLFIDVYYPQYEKYKS